MIRIRIRQGILLLSWKRIIRTGILMLSWVGRKGMIRMIRMIRMRGILLLSWKRIIRHPAVELEEDDKDRNPPVELGGEEEDDKDRVHQIPQLMKTTKNKG